MTRVHFGLRSIPIFLFAGVLLAAPAALGDEPRRIAATGLTLGEVMQRHREPRSAQRPTSSSNPNPELACSDALLIQGAANLVGKNGEHFVSDVTISNKRKYPQDVFVYWLAADQDNTAATAKYSATLDKQTSYDFENFVSTTLNESGLGAVLIFSWDSIDNFYTCGLDDELDVVSRIRTPIPGTEGDASLSFPAVAVGDPSETGPTYAIGLKQNADFRTNVGIVNLDGQAHTFTVEVLGTGISTSFELTIPPYSLSQSAIPAGNFGNLRLRVTPDAEVEYSVYGVSVDNRTGDGWANHGSRYKYQ
jgi:hypothetical protein